MTSIIKVDEIQTTSGSGFVKPMAGSIIQIQYTQVTASSVMSSMGSYEQTLMLDHECVHHTHIYIKQSKD